MVVFTLKRSVKKYLKIVKKINVEKVCIYIGNTGFLGIFNVKKFIPKKCKKLQKNMLGIYIVLFYTVTKNSRWNCRKKVGNVGDL